MTGATWARDCSGYGGSGLGIYGSSRGVAIGGSGSGYWRLEAREKVGMKMFGPPPPLFINQLDN